jgi:anti-anti-sigma regulatory factor
LLKITWTNIESAAPSVRVEGEIAGEHVAELERFAETAAQPGTRILFDVSDVTFVDHAGAVLLRRLRDDGFVFLNGSSFVAMVIDAPTDPATRPGEME